MGLRPAKVDEKRRFVIPSKARDLLFRVPSTTRGDWRLFEGTANRLVLPVCACTLRPVSYATFLFPRSRSFRTRLESKDFAFSNSVRRSGVSPDPARFMK